MPRKDFYHDTVVRALIADGWTITADPLFLSYGGRDAYVDLGAERPIGAEKEGRRIAVEIKSFFGPSDVHELQQALGQFELYLDILAEVDPERALYLAIPLHAYQGIFSEPLGQLVLRRHQMQLLVFDDTQERIVQWIP